jgi:transposase
MQITTLGIDLAKNVFCVHGCDANGKAVLRKQLVRRHLLNFMANLPPCLVAMEACASAHYWAREIEKLGHQVAADRAQVRKALRQSQQERRQRRRGERIARSSRCTLSCASESQACISASRSARISNSPHIRRRP